MKRAAVTGLLSVLVVGLSLQAVSKGREKLPREATEWCNVWLPNADKSDLPKVLLIGDSITQGYYGGVSEHIKEKAYCNYVTTSWSVCNPGFMAQLEIILGQYSYKVIHFNNGLHGFGHSLAEYRSALEKVIVRVKELSPGTRIIWANSTPTKSKDGTDERNVRIDRRNAAAKEIMERHGIAVNDLNTPMRAHPEYYRDDYHFHGNIISIQAEQVAGVIKEHL